MSEPDALTLGAITVRIHLRLARWWRPAWAVYRFVALLAARTGLVSRHALHQGARRPAKRALQSGSYVEREAR